MAYSRVKVGQESNALATGYGLLSTAGVALGAYHGYKRTDSVGWAVGWAVLGGLFPFVTIPVSIAQGFGEREK